MSAARASVRDRLASGPPRGLGCTNAIVAEALRAPESVAELVSATRDPRTVVTIRAANALDKIQREQPEAVAKHSHKLVRAALECEDLRTRWNLIEVIGRLPLHGSDLAIAIDLMFEALRSNSGILRALAITGLAEYAQHDAELRKRVRIIVENALEDPSAATRARARKLLPKL